MAEYLALPSDLPPVDALPPGPSMGMPRDYQSAHPYYIEGVLTPDRSRVAWMVCGRYFDTEIASCFHWRDALELVASLDR